MRPPQFAGEAVRGGRCGNKYLGVLKSSAASMRPPQFAGEDKDYKKGKTWRQLASMRPPQFAGEDHVVSPFGGGLSVASMRPPQFAGEDRACGCDSRRALRRFNEAPAVRGGRLVDEQGNRVVDDKLQ